MTDREALAMLIEKSDLPSDEMRRNLLENLPAMKDEDILAVGKFFAAYESATNKDLSAQKDAATRLLEEFSKQGS